MADPLPISVMSLPEADPVVGGERLPVHQNGRLRKVDPRALVADVLPGIPLSVDGRDDTIEGHLEDLAEQGSVSRLRRPAAVPIPDWCAVYIDDQGAFRPADSRDALLFGRVVGVVAYGAPVGESLVAQSLGDLRGPLGQFPGGKTLFVGASGALTPVPHPDAVWRQSVAVSVTESDIVVALAEAERVQTGVVPISTQGYAYPSTTAEIEAGLSVAGFLSPLRFKPILDRILALIDGLFNRSRTAVDFGAVADGVETLGGDGYSTVTGTDNTAAFNNYSVWCRDNKRTFILPAGDFLARGQLTFWTDVEFQPGARLLLPNNDTGQIESKIIVSPLPGDVSPIPVSEVRTWTGCYKGSRIINGLTGRKGQVVSINCPDQVNIMRIGDRASLIGQTFVVDSNTGDIATSLVSDWNNAAWTTDNGQGVGGEIEPWYFAETLRPQITLKNLNIVLYDDGATTQTGYVLRVKRSNTRTKGLRIVNRAPRPIAHVVSIHRMAGYCDIKGYVEGALGGSTSYGWYYGLSVDGYNEGSQAINCRRGVDNGRSTDVFLLNCILPTGWGMHYGHRMGSIGGVLGCKGDDNYAVNVAGGDCYVHDADVQLEGRVVGSGGSAAFPTFISARGDYWEHYGRIESRGCRVIVPAGTPFARLTTFRGPAGGYDTTRATEMPRLIKVSAQVEMLGDADQRLHLIAWQQDWTSTQMPRPILVESDHDFDVSVRFANGGVLTTAGAPRVLAEYWSPPPINAGQSYDGYVRARFRGLPSFELFTRTTRIEAVNTKGRLDADIQASGPVRITRAPGCYRQIRVDAPSLTQLVDATSATFAAIGDESVRLASTPANPLDITPVKPVISNRFTPGFILPAAVTFTRASSGTYFDSRGLLVSAGTNVPRYTSDPFTGANLGLLIEGGGTNFLLNSASPATQTVSLAAGTYTLSVIGTGSATLSGGPTGTATRLSPVTFTLGATTNVTVTVSGSVSRFQLENGALATSIILTTTAAASRQRDVYSHSLTDIWHTPEGTFVFDAYAPAGTGGLLQQAAEWGDGTTSNRLLIARNLDTAAGVSLAIGGTAYPITLNVPWPDRTRLRMAIAVGDGTIAVSTNGSAPVIASAPGLPPATRMLLGDGANGQRPFFGSILSVDYFQRRLPNDALPALSTRV